MANDDFFENFLRNSSNYNGGLEYYEDTHDAYGNYIGSRPAQNGGAPQYTTPVQGTSDAAQRTEQSLNNPTQIYSTAPQNSTVKQSKAKPLPTTADGIAAQLNKKFVIYRPRTTADVEQLIAYLRRGEPALVDLDPISDKPDAQRLMDFTSGAAYALGDRVITVRRNLFLITPDTMDVLKPESDS
ncbi:MAG: cell division protein SepF [Clostridiales bacterium]|nr:cell division protein SepF [Clostridiales bacterium]